MLNCFTGVLPRPMRSIQDGTITYRIDVTFEDLMETSTKLYEVDVVETEEDCEDGPIAPVAGYDSDQNVPVVPDPEAPPIPEGFEGAYADETEVADTTDTTSDEETSQEKESSGFDPSMALIGAGAGLATIPLLNLASEGADCGPAPTIPSSCLGIGRMSSTCRAAIQDYTAWCNCQGGSFDITTGSCH